MYDDVQGVGADPEEPEQDLYDDVGGGDPEEPEQAIYDDATGGDVSKLEVDKSSLYSGLSRIQPPKCPN